MAADAVAGERSADIRDAFDSVEVGRMEIGAEEVRRAILCHMEILWEGFEGGNLGIAREHAGSRLRASYGNMDRRLVAWNDDRDGRMGGSGHCSRNPALILVPSWTRSVNVAPAERRWGVGPHLTPISATRDA